MLFNIYLAASLLADLLITFSGDLLNSFADIWKPVLLFAGLFAVCLIIHIVLILVIAPLAKSEGEISKPVRWITLQTAHVVLRLLRVKVHTSGMELIPNDQRFLLVCNHKTNFDPIIGIYIFRKYRLAYVSKKENFNIPVGNKLIRGIGCLALDRENDRAAVKTIIKAANLVKSGEMSMGIYPEGKTNRTSEPLLPFRNGAFKIAQRAAAPIVVVTTCGTEQISKNIFKRKNVYVDVLRLMLKDEITGVHTDVIGNAVYDIMLENIIKRNSMIYR